ncbi:MAG: phosphotransferase [Rickettsiales bacterium]|nr:phosphotransferase [Rickettsiales bacterium]
MNDASRENILRQFLTDSGWGNARRAKLAGDASFRHYERIKLDNNRAVLMDAPPAHEDVRPYLYIAEHLLGHRFSAPRVLAKDVENGFLLLEDLGDDRFTRILRGETLLQPVPSQESIYRIAIDVLVALHRCPLPVDVPLYDKQKLLNEVKLVTDWYLPLMHIKVDTDAYLQLWDTLLDDIAVGSNVLIHRDYHADNLMWLPERQGIRKVGLLDFQDAVIGPPTYDLLSLLEDARRDVPLKLAHTMLRYYLSQFPAIDKEQFFLSYAILAAQRNCKIIGIFSRLAVRDNKHQYLAFLPRVWRYLMRDMKHPALLPLKEWMESTVDPSLRKSPPVMRNSASQVA